MKICMIDDDPEFLEELQEILGFHGYDVKTFQDGHDLLAETRNERPDLFIVDLKMPGKSGCELARELKDDKETRDIPLLAISAFYDGGDLPPLLRVHGFEEVLSKPFQLDDLLKKVDALLTPQFHSIDPQDINEQTAA